MRTRRTKLIKIPAMTMRSKALSTKIELKVEESEISSSLTDCDMHDIYIKQEGIANNFKKQADS